jgi:hypothetical protein
MEVGPKIPKKQTSHEVGKRSFGFRAVERENVHQIGLESFRRLLQEEYESSTETLTKRSLRNEAVAKAHLDKYLVVQFERPRLECGVLVGFAGC